MKTFLSVGSKHIFPEVFQPIKNSNGIKPNGGLWATEQNENETEYNSWVNFLSYNLDVLFYKSRLDDPFKVPAVFLTLKDNANIFTLSNKNELEFLKSQYPDNNGWIDFEALAKDYDGIFVSISKLFQEDIDFDIKIKLLKFSVDTLILFSLDCIDYYQQAEIDIAPFDYEYEQEFFEYRINILSQKETIISPVDCSSLIDKIKDFIIKHGGSEKELIAQIHDTFKKEIDATIHLIEKNNNTKSSDIETLLIRKSFKSI